MLTTATNRQTRILEIVREKGFASIEHLAGHFDVTQQTVRRVVNRLCDQGLLRRIHGGVSLPVQNQNLAYGSRQGLNPDAKRRIAHAVSNFIPDGASLMIGLGTTPEYVAQALSHRQDLTGHHQQPERGRGVRAQSRRRNHDRGRNTASPRPRYRRRRCSTVFFRLQGRFRNFRRRRHRSGRHPARFSFGRSSRRVRPSLPIAESPCWSPTSASSAATPRCAAAILAIAIISSPTSRCRRGFVRSPNNTRIEFTPPTMVA